jgi:hypothetical protein
MICTLVCNLLLEGNIMDTENNLHLIKFYREQSDEQIMELLRLGQDSFEKEAYEIIRNEARCRGLDKETHDIKGIDKPFGEMTRVELLGLFLSGQTMEPDLYNALCAEAFRRNICRDEIEHLHKEILKAQKKADNEEETGTCSQASNPLPLIILESLEDAQPYFNALAEAGVPYNIQIMVDEEDYEQADSIISQLQPDEGLGD